MRSISRWGSASVLFVIALDVIAMPNALEGEGVVVLAFPHAGKGQGVKPI